MAFFKFFVLLYCSLSVITAQQLQLHLVWQNSPLQLHKAIKIEHDSLIITKCQFYLQYVNTKSNTQHPIAANTVYLLTFDSSANIQVAIPNLQPDTIQFGIGIDSALHFKGIQNGFLDPIHGMYWTWQSGYINFKIEGRIKTDNKPWQKIEYHIGGYRSPYNCFQVWNCTAYNYEYDVSVVLKPWLDAHMYTIMSPGQDAFKFSTRLPHAFKQKAN